VFSKAPGKTKEIKEKREILLKIGFRQNLCILFCVNFKTHDPIDT